MLYKRKELVMKKAMVSLLIFLLLFSCGCAAENPRSEVKPQEKPAGQPVSASPEGAASPGPSASAEPASPSESPCEQPDHEPEVPPGDSAGLLMLDRGAYAERPHAIRTGTVFTLGTNVSSLFLPWLSQPDVLLASNVCEGLLYMYMNDPGDIRGCIAESWEHSDDMLTWTFRIRPGILFHDGTVCDAPAVASCWDCIGDVMGRPLLEGYDISYEAADSSTLIIKLSSPCPYFEQAACSRRFTVVSPSALKLYGFGDLRTACGTGPYRIDSADTMEQYAASAVLKAWDHYYLPEKAPCIETVNIRTFSSEDLLDSVIDGSVDAAVVGYSPFHTSGENTLSYLKNRGYGGTPVIAAARSDPMWFNPEAAPQFASPEVRKAISLLLDRDALNELLYNGYGKPQRSIWMEGSPSYLETDGYDHDPDLALGLLAEAGYAPEDISFTVNNSGDLRLEAVRDELAAFGIGMAIEEIPPESSYTPAPSSEPVYFMSVNDTCTAPYYLWSLVLPRESRFNLCRQYIYNSELYQRMLEEYSAMNSDGRWEDVLYHCRELTRMVQEDFGAVGTVEVPGIILFNGSFKDGVFFSETRNIQFYYLYA